MINNANPAFSQIGTVASTICGKNWDLSEIDGSLKQAVIHCLEVIEAFFLVAHFKKAGVTLWCCSPRYGVQVPDVNVLLHEVEASVTESLKSRAGVKELADYYIAVWVNTSEDRFHERSAPENDYCAVVFRKSAVDARLPEDRHRILNEHARSTTYVIFEALRQRTDLFLPFSPKVSERYWADALTPRDLALSLRPPWTTEASLPTVSLSFDLRKSTFCMENADSPSQFASWIDQLVRILTKIAHFQGGVFDKFTGDGALVHFLDRECREVYDKLAVVAALECAIGMQRATARHLNNLREFLRLDSERLGGAIGIDVASAHWSLDHRNNPIVVGRGVVGACRLGDGTPGGRVRLTNIAFRKIRSTNASVFPIERVPFTSKEFSKEMKLTAWELDASMIGSGPSWAWIDQISSEIYGLESRNMSPGGALAKDSEGNCD